jgi:hypothetical protein
VIYPLLMAGALITLAPFGLGLLTTFHVGAAIQHRIAVVWPDLADVGGLPGPGRRRVRPGDGGDPLDDRGHTARPLGVLRCLAMESLPLALVITSGGQRQVLTVVTAGLRTCYNAQWTLVMAATTVAIVPLIGLFVAFSRHIIRSIVVTGLK